MKANEDDMTEHTSEPTCPICGNDEVETVDGISTCYRAHIWIESEESIQRIRALEGELAAVRIDADAHYRHYVNACADVDTLRADNARLAGERDNAVRALATQLENVDRLEARATALEADGRAVTFAKVPSDTGDRIDAAEAPVADDLRKIRGLIEELDASVFGEGSTSVTAPDGEVGLMTWPIRDELVDKLSQCIRRIDATPETTTEEGDERSI